MKVVQLSCILNLMRFKIPKYNVLRKYWLLAQKPEFFSLKRAKL